MAIRFLADQSTDDQLTIQGSTTSPLLRLYNNNNGGEAQITFSDHATQGQIGTFKYVHTDTASYGSGNAFIFESDQTTLSVLADGKLLFKEGLFIKPTSGTGGGTQLISSAGAYKIPSISNAGTDTDQFLVRDSSGNVDFRTGAEVRSDIGAGTGSGTVTSVGITAGTGISVSGSPVTSSGSITVTNSSPDTGVPAILSDGTSPSLNTGITGAEVRSLIGAGTSSTSGTVTSVGLSIDETEALAVKASSTPVTGSGTLELEWQGDSSEVVLGSGELATLPTSDTGVPAILSDGTSPSLNTGITAAEVRTLIGAGTSSTSGTVTSIATTAPITGGTITGTGTIGIDNATGTTVGAAAIQAGTGISVSDSNGVYTITNSSPSSGGTVTGVTGTAPIVSSGGAAPDISISNATGTTVGAAAIEAGTGISVSDSNGVYTITNSSPSSGGTVTSVSATAPVQSSGGTTPTISVDTDPVAAGSAKLSTGDQIQTAIDSAVSGLGSGTVTSVAVSAGTGISISGSPITSSGTITVTNSAPDQTVALTAGTGISVSGTYPNFTITNSSPASGSGITGSGTSGKVAKFTGGSSIGDGDITFGTNTITLGDPTSSSTATLFVDTQNRRVGYRTINPTSAFEVVGTINTQGLNCNEKQFFSPKDNNYIQAGAYGGGEFFGMTGSENQPKYTYAAGSGGKFVEDERIETVKIEGNGFLNWHTNGCIIIPAQGANTFILVKEITVYKSAGSNSNMGTVYFGFCEQASPTANCQMFGTNHSFDFWAEIDGNITQKSGTWLWQSNRPMSGMGNQRSDISSRLNRPLVARVSQGSNLSSGTFNGPWYIQVKYSNVNYLAGLVNNEDRTVTSTGSGGGGGSRTQFLGSSVTNFSTICPGNANIPPDANQSYHFDNTSGCNGNNGYPASGDIVYTSATGSTVAAAGYIFLYSGGGSRYYIQIGASGIVQGTSCTDSVSECDQPDS